MKHPAYTTPTRPLLAFFPLLLAASFLLMLLFSTCEAQAAERVAFVASASAIAADEYSTVTVLRRGGYELNPILGPRPSVARVVGYTVLAEAANAVLPRLVHNRAVRTGWWVTLTVWEVALVLHNNRVAR